MPRTRFSRTNKTATQEAGFEAAPKCLDQPLSSGHDGASQGEVVTATRSKKRLGLVGGLLLDCAIIAPIGASPAIAEDAQAPVMTEATKSRFNDHLCVGSESDLTRMQFIVFWGDMTLGLPFCKDDPGVPKPRFPFNDLLYNQLRAICGDRRGYPKLADKIRPLGDDPRVAEIVRNCKLTYSDNAPDPSVTDWGYLFRIDTPNGRPFETIRDTKAQRDVIDRFIRRKQQDQCNPERPLSMYDWC